MTPEQTAEQTVSAFFLEQAPPSRDLAFEARVAERIARRRAVATVAVLLPWTIATSVLLWALGPLVMPIVDGLGQTLVPAAAILALTALTVGLAAAAGRRLAPT